MYYPEEYLVQVFIQEVSSANLIFMLVVQVRLGYADIFMPLLLLSFCCGFTIAGMMAY